MKYLNQLPAQVTAYKRAYRRVLQMHEIMMQGGTVNIVSTVLAAAIKAENKLSADIAERVRKSVDQAFGLPVE